MGAPVGVIPVGFRFYKALIAAKASQWGCSPATVAAICWQESSFETNGFRFEPAFWNRYLKGNPRYAALNPLRVSSSYGLMQVMYCRILEDKIADNDVWPPEMLFIPEHGLDIGCALFFELLTWAQSKTADVALQRRAALAAYNGGRGGNDPSKDSPLRNGKYAREVELKITIMEKEFV